MSIYANPLVDTIDQDRLIPYRLYRDHCFSYQGSYILIVDNSPNAYHFHPENAVPILSWYDDPDDKCLFEMLPLLEALSQVDDVRKVIPRFVNREIALVDYPVAAKVFNEL
jgi:carboxy-terminal domain RNA polymerase II polypeptide A small phosphatase